MTEQQAAERILALRQIIDYHSARYYDEDAPEIEDDEFDAADDFDYADDMEEDFDDYSDFNEEDDEFAEVDIEPTEEDLLNIEE